MSFNLRYHGADIDKNIEAIAASSPDVLCLQEVTRPFVRRFEQQLGRDYPHRHFEPRVGTWGLGIASKHALTHARIFPQKPHRMPAMEARVQIGGKSITISCLHLFPPVAKRHKGISLFEAIEQNARLRIEQARGIVSRYATTNRPILLLGDMNEADDDDAILAFVDAGFAIACDIEDADCGATYPGAVSFWPAVFQIDHILGRGVRFIEASVEQVGGSDHYPVVVRFHL